MKADAVAVFIPQTKEQFKQETSRYRKLLGSGVDRAIALERFQGKHGEILSLYTERKLAAPKLYLVGLGELGKLSPEQYRRAAAAAAKQAAATKMHRLAIALPEFEAPSVPIPDTAAAIAEGALLSLYRYDKYLTEKRDEQGQLAELTIFSPHDAVIKAIKTPLHDARIVCEAAMLARDLENAPSSELYPETLAAAARESAERFGYRCAVWDLRKIQQMGFGGLAAVNAGSTRPARFIILEHNAGRGNHQTVVLVGKGITFDSGGISIKPSAGMAEMKMDMSGAAAVIATLEAATRLRIPHHIIGLIPATENMPGGSSMRPGDIITHYGGKTSEVDNTDAEGRLVLADALAYAASYKPQAVIDLATLTGACVVALGQHATGMMGNDQELMSQLKAAGEKTFERVWELPLFEEYEKQIKSDVADVKNVGGRWAGAITAGLFLKKFVNKYKWVHLDIAGTAILEESLPYTPKGGSGVGVRLLVEFLRNWNVSL